MKTLFKLLIALLVTVLTPIAAFILVSLLDMSLLGTFGTLRGLLDFIFGWTMLCGIFGLPIAFAHILLFGLPTFLLGWYYRAIHWWSTLVMAFIIGAAPTAMFVLMGLERPYDGPFSLPLGLELYSLGLLTIEGILHLKSGTSIVFLMGLFGVSAGLVFWLLWRYWVFPGSPAGRPLLPQVEVKSLVANE